MEVLEHKNMEGVRTVWGQLTGRIAVRLYLFVVALCVTYYFLLPSRLFNDPYSTVLQDSSGELLSAAIAADGQWRFPQIQAVPEKFSQALITFEDKDFFHHHGIDLLAMGRAIKQNIQAGRIVSGGSTISMQVIRLSGKGMPRTVWQKLLEIILATRLELRCDKQEILSLYASHAPFGGNVVGLEAACWRYFGRGPDQLSWAEAALLAVLPNAPAMIHPGKNREKLKKKRDWLLNKLLAHGLIDAETCLLSKAERIPDAPHPLPSEAHHLLTRAANEGYSGRVIESTIDRNLQHVVEGIVNDHYLRLAGNQIFNASALVLDVRSGNALAYVGNTNPSKSDIHGNAVDVITAPRSTGSILKPILYAAMLDEGKILPGTLLPDVPTTINGFSPKNFSKAYDGVVHADEALVRSLNIPAVQLLKTYRYEKFHALLKKVGMHTLDQSAEHYGLALILGGAEGTLWDVCGIYGSMARSLTGYFQHPGKDRYDKTDFHSPHYLKIKNGPMNVPSLEATSWLSAASIYQTFNALTELYRPGEESGWKHFSSATKIAWKTGTSFGFRDGWAIGVTPEYVVGVWVGNADGEGRPGLTGIDAAAPIMFDIFSRLEGRSWFKRPEMEMKKISVCRQSGQRNTAFCSATDSLWVVTAGLQSRPCGYHKEIHVTKDGKFRVHAACEGLDNMRKESWFVLPPMQEYYFRSKNLSFRPLPAFRKDCEVTTALSAMDLIYPKPDSRIFIPRELNGVQGQAVFQVAHRNSQVTIHWHLDGAYVGSTMGKHFLPVRPGAGKHTLVVVDENGQTLQERFEVLSVL